MNRKQTEAMWRRTWSSLGAVVTGVSGTMCLLLHLGVCTAAFYLWGLGLMLSVEVMENMLAIQSSLSSSQDVLLLSMHSTNVVSKARDRLLMLSQ